MIVVVGNLIVDLLYAILDPRAGRETVRTRTKSLAGGAVKPGMTISLVVGRG